MHRRLIPFAIAVAAASALTACSDGEPAATPPADAPVAALPPGRPAIYQAAGVGPEAFVRALYAVYVAGGPTEPPPAPGQDPIYSRKMNAAMGADVRVAKGEVPDINYDPLCGCQDQEGFALDSLAVTRSGSNAAEAVVAFTNRGEQTRQTLKLVREGVNWKVDDVVGTDGKSLQAGTIDSIVARGG